MAEPGQKNFSGNINEPLSDKFTQQAEDRGYTKYRAIEGALRCWLALPSDIQVKLMELKNSELLTMDEIIDSIGKSQFQADIEAAFAEFAKRQGIAQPESASKRKKRSSTG